MSKVIIFEALEYLPVGERLLQLTQILTLPLTVGLARPYYVHSELKNRTSRMVVMGRTVKFSASVGEVYQECLMIALLSVVTVGLYVVFGFAKNRWAEFVDKHLGFTDGQDDKAPWIVYRARPPFCCIGCCSEVGTGLTCGCGYACIERMRKGAFIDVATFGGMEFQLRDVEAGTTCWNCAMDTFFGLLTACFWHVCGPSNLEQCRNFDSKLVPISAAGMAPGMMPFGGEGVGAGLGGPGMMGQGQGMSMGPGQGMATGPGQGMSMGSGPGMTPTLNGMAGQLGGGNNMNNPMAGPSNGMYGNGGGPTPGSGGPQSGMGMNGGGMGTGMNGGGMGMGMNGGGMGNGMNGGGMSGMPPGGGFPGGAPPQMGYQQQGNPNGMFGGGSQIQQSAYMQ